MSDSDANSEPRPDTAAKLLGEWREALTRAVEEAERFAREKPAAALGAAFAAGLLFSTLVRRR